MHPLAGAWMTQGGTTLDCRRSHLKVRKREARWMMMLEEHENLEVLRRSRRKRWMGLVLR